MNAILYIFGAVILAAPIVVIVGSFYYMYKDIKDRDRDAHR